MSLPKYFKDASGYCYAATDVLAKKPGMTAWDGPVGADGYAAPEPADPAPQVSRSRQRRLAVQSQPDASESSDTGAEE